MEEQYTPGQQSPQSIQPLTLDNASTSETSAQESPRQATHEESKKELLQAIEGSADILATATTTLTLFPDTLTLDRAKVTVTKRTFFQAAEVVSMRIEDILNVTATVGPLFGTVKVVSRVLNPEKPYVIGKFWREDAVRLKRIIQGYVIALQRRIDCSVMPTQELVGMLDKLGEDEHGA